MIPYKQTDAERSRIFDRAHDPVEDQFCGSTDDEDNINLEDDEKPGVDDE